MLKNLKSISKNSIIYSFGAISAKLVGFILLPLYTHHLTLEEYGILAILEITSQVILTVFGISLYRALMRWYWDKEYINKQKSLFFTGLIFLAVFSSIVTAMIYFFSEQISLWLLDSSSYSYLITLMAISAQIQILIHFTLSLMRIQEKPLLYSTSNLVKLICTLTLTIVLIVKFGHGISGIFEAQIFGQFVFIIIVLPYLIRNIQLKIEGKILIQMIRFSYPLALASVSGIVLTLTDRYALKFLATFSDVGIYSLGFKIANTIKVFLVSSVQLALTPYIYKMMDDPNRYRFYSKIMTYFAFMVMMFVIFLSIFGLEIISILVPQKSEYLNAYLIIPIISLSIYFATLKDTATTGINITKKTNITALLFLITGLLNIALNILFIPYWKAIGAGVATLISHIFFFFIMYYFAQKEYAIPYELKKILKITFSGISLIAVSFMLPHLSIFLTILIKMFLILIFPIVLYFLNFYEEKELINIKRGFHLILKPKQWKKILDK